MTLAEINKALRDLYEIKPARVYGELTFYGLLGWFFFIYSLVYSQPWAVIPSGIFFYKALSFIHEVSHLEKTLPYIKLLYNVLLGFPHRVPAYTMRTHKYHHGIKTFGKMTDPEYENWTARPRFHLLRPLMLSPFYPIVLCIRFGLWPFLLLLLPKNITLKTYETFASFVMNLKYKRPYQEADFFEYRKHDIICALIFVFTCIILSFLGLFKIYFIHWSLMVTGIYILNTYRALVAHRYQVDKNPKDNKQIEQLVDSVTVEGNIITPLWAPIGLQYHSTHHLLPSLPYYSLKKAHYRLKEILPAEHEYFQTIETSFLVAFTKLMKSCR